MLSNHSVIRVTFLLYLCLTVLGCRRENIVSLNYDDFSKVILHNVQTGYANEHVAFTDLICFGGKFYVVFSEGLSHSGYRDFGRVILMESPDFKDWYKINEFKYTNWVLRDPKLLIIGNKLHISSNSLIFNQKDLVEKQASLLLNFDSDTGAINLSVFENADLWLWNYISDPTRFNYLAFAYNLNEKHFILISTKDFKRKSLVGDFSYLGYNASEAEIIIGNSFSLYTIVRTEKKLLGASNLISPHRVQWKQLDINDLCGPKFYYI